MFCTNRHAREKADCKVMAAFVPTGSFSGATLQSSLRHVCGARPTQRAAGAYGLRMTLGSPGITLQRLVYEPNPGPLCVEDKDIMCTRVWKQVFGNAYVMESERAEAYKAESMYRANRITAKEFVRAVALSDTYRRRFFECCTPFRAAELNYKHLLARAPASKAEMQALTSIISTDGFEAGVNTLIDSVEYEQAFGEDFVPGRRFKGTYPTIEEFNSMCDTYSSPGTTDKSLTLKAKEQTIDNSNRVLSLDGAGTASKYMAKTAMGGTSSFVGISRGIPKRANVDFGQYVAPLSIVNDRADPRRRVEVVPGSFMFLSQSEIAAMEKEQLSVAKLQSAAEKELADTKKELETLKARIVALESFV